MSNRFVVLSGCSGGGKSTLLEELARRGHETVAEPGRRVVSGELVRAGTALPWIDPVAFARRAMKIALADHATAAAQSGWILFDRGLVDAVSALEHEAPGASDVELLGAYRYHRQVFLVPPWACLFGNDDERRHSFADAVAEYDRLLVSYPAAGYEVSILPRISVVRRADLVEIYLATATPE